MFVYINSGDVSDTASGICVPLGQTLISLNVFSHRVNFENVQGESRASLITQSLKSLPAMIPRLGRSPVEGNGSSLQYSCLENPMDRGAWWATVCGVARVGHDLVTKPPPPPG